MKRQVLKSVVAMGLAVSFVGCGGAETDEELATVKQELSNGYYMSSSTGAMLRPSGGSWDAVSSDMIYSAAWESYAAGHPQRFNIVDWSDWENIGGLCGDAAHVRYNAEPGAKWCTEYARWVLTVAGMRNIRYCATSIFGVCFDYVYLNEATSVSDMVGIYEANGGWVSQSKITTSTLIEPGDYLALTGSSGEKKSHSALVMAVSSDKRYVWTSEGNVGDCVSFMRRDLFVNGVLNPDINGLGKTQVAF